MHGSDRMDPEEKMHDYYQTFLTASNQTDNRSKKQLFREMSCGLNMMQTFARYACNMILCRAVPARRMVCEGHYSAGAASLAPGLARQVRRLHPNCQVQLKPLDQQQAARMVWKANRQDGVRSRLKNGRATQRFLAKAAVRLRWFSAPRVALDEV